MIVVALGERIPRPVQSIECQSNGEVLSRIDWGDALNLLTQVLQGHCWSRSVCTEAGRATPPLAIAPFVSGTGSPKTTRAGTVPDHTGRA